MSPKHHPDFSPPSKHHPFVLFRLPGENTSQWIQQEAPIEQSIMSFANLPEDDSGFLFAPFQENSNCPLLFIRPDHFFKVKDFEAVRSSYKTSRLNQRTTQDVTKEEYLKIHSKIKDKFKAKVIDKVVLSRVVTTHFEKNFNALDAYQSLCKAYPNAFVYLASLGTFGEWIGATPELLVKKEKDKYQTVALAGTQERSGQKTETAEWTAKEIEEQAYVVQFIRDELKKQGAHNLKESPRRTVVAGNLLHLMTQFAFELSNSTLANLLKALHPTPAVCGLPRASAKELINDLESHDRRYYSGFLGPINMQQQTALFVNLRCAEILEGKLHLYVGGGITDQSIPENEWKETEWKANTLLSVIKKI